jgi:pimeloyl-ACP methyl ester carboxylesterase
MENISSSNVNEIPITFQSLGQQIVGIWHRGKQSKLVILCHGFTGNKVESRRIFVEAGRAFVEQGLDALRFDFYGSGDSAGEFADSSLSINVANLRDAVLWAGQQGYQDIAVLGMSMGGATAILALPDPAVKALITWSSVPDVQQLFSSLIQGWESRAEQTDVFEYEGWLIKKSFWQDAVQHDIIKSFASITIPKLIIQGTADSPVFTSGFEAFRRVAQPPADFMQVPGAGHTFSNPSHRQQVIRQTLIWLKRHL